ncbi:MAG: hypothetical protein ACTS73_04815 [Arsenophonus sp. NEOnobi-MAG3]
MPAILLDIVLHLFHCFLRCFAGSNEKLEAAKEFDLVDPDPAAAK